MVEGGGVNVAYFFRTFIKNSRNILSPSFEGENLTIFEIPCYVRSGNLYYADKYQLQSYGNSFENFGIT